MPAYTVETTQAKITTTASNADAAARLVQILERCPASAILKVSPARLHFVEITYYDRPTDRRYYLNAEEAAAAYAETTEEASELFGQWAQIRQGQQVEQKRRITHRHNNT